MARITRDTFDPLHSYISVRLQQGVPLVDADWNEAQDVRKFEVQAFLKWFVGNGVPEDNDGFHIAGLTSVRVGNNPPVWDFVIECGIDAVPDGTSPLEQGLRHVGRCLVDGMDVIIAADINFRAQKLHVSWGRAATDLASLLGVPTIADVPVGDDPEVVSLVVVYLDVWERLVTPDEEPGLVHSGLGVESSARLKREWVVRAREGSSVPTPSDPTDLDESIRFIAGHSYYALATIAYKGNDPITDETITDQRERRLLMPPATLIEDLFGPVDYRRGQGRPRVNLREAINVLLRGELPGSPETPIDFEGPFLSTRRGTFFDAAHGLITTWQSGILPSQLFAARLDLAKPEAGFRHIQPIAEVGSYSPNATLLHTGEVLLVYQVAFASDIRMKRGMLTTLTPNSPVTNVTEDHRNSSPFAVAVGRQVLILYGTLDNRYRFKWYNVANETTDPISEGSLSDRVTLVLGDLHAAVDSKNTVWVAFIANRTEIIAIVVPPSGQPGQSQILFSSNDGIKDPFVMVDNNDNVWVFWRAISSGEGGIWYLRFLRTTNQWGTAKQVQFPGTITGEQGELTAVSDADGGICLFWARSDNTSVPQRPLPGIWYARHNPVTRIWGEPRQITGELFDVNPFVLHSPDGSLWLFWNRFLGPPDYKYQPFYRRIFPSI